ncbi:hypothetical protein SAMN05216554_3266 [Herbiconiux ginsengi]|uniref:Uncharacterized protein n=1 Tax=Herbiconiux ginsengi TaxID=381665 RepID=A0A1H3S2J8_9MICO|nr:hypothetical protein SAMN05216554_3266 [Herbiconiux ginsengi]
MADSDAPPIPHAAVTYATGAGLVVLSALGIVIGGFAAEQTLVVQFALCRPALEPFDEPFVYSAAIATLAAVFAVAGWLVRRDPLRWGFAGWLVAVACGGVLCFGWVSLLGVGFWGMSREEASTGESWWGMGLLFLIALAGPALASLAAAISVLAVRSPRVSALLPACVFLLGTGVSIAVLALHSAASCTGYGG